MTQITRDNIDELLDKGLIETCGANGKWYTIRRNGKTKLWKTNPRRIEIPCKVGLRECFTITQYDFDPDTGVLKDYYRAKEY